MGRREYLAKLITSELPRYRSLTKVQVGDSAHASFWHDRWLLDTTLADSFPALHSHCLDDFVSVQSVLATDIREHLHPRLTRAAAAERVVLSTCLSRIHLTDEPDVRVLASERPQPFSTRGAYHLLHVSETTSDVVRIWASRLPTKVKFFAWLRHHGRLNTRAHLYHRNIKTLEESWCEHCPGTIETDVHILCECPRAQALWDRLRFVVQEPTLRRPWECTLAIPLPEVIQNDMMQLILWHL